MARIRSVHPSLFTDEAWVSCSPLARILYIGLWTDADDQGLFEWKPLQIKMRLLPGDATNTAELLAELGEAGLLAKFEHGGKPYGALKDFRRYQRPKKPNAIHPLPEAWREYVGLGDPEAADGEPDPTEVELVPNPAPTPSEKSPQMEDGGGREGEGRKEPTVPRPAKPNPATDDFETAWQTYPPKGRERSKSRDKTRPIWREAAKGAGGSDRLLSCVQRYVREDQTHKGECGPPAFDRWLRDGRWEHWLPEARGPTGPHISPELQALEARLLGKSHVPAG